MSNCRRDYVVPPSGNDSIPQQTGNNPENKRFIVIGRFLYDRAIGTGNRSLFLSKTVAILRDSGINISH